MRTVLIDDLLLLRATTAIKNRKSMPEQSSQGYSLRYTNEGCSENGVLSIALLTRVEVLFSLKHLCSPLDSWRIARAIEVNFS